MPSFGKTSKSRLETCHEDLQKILNEAIQFVDFSIVEGHRPVEKQFDYFKRGRKEIDGVWKIVNKRKVITHIDGYKKKGKHNYDPSLAVDIVPWISGKGQDWNDLERFRRITYFIKGIAFANGIDLRIGGDWDGDFYINDQSFHDIPHLELHSKLVDGVWVRY